MHEQWDSNYKNTEKEIGKVKERERKKERDKDGLNNFLHKRKEGYYKIQSNWVLEGLTVGWYFRIGQGSW